MASKTVVTIHDDINGKPGATPDVLLMFNGTAVYLDLGDESMTELSAALRPFLSAGRPVKLRNVLGGTGGRPRHGSGTGPTGTVPQVDRDQAQAVRAWAKEQGHNVSERGRVPAKLVEMYNQAMAAPAPVLVPVESAPTPAKAAPAKRTPKGSDNGDAPRQPKAAAARKAPARKVTAPTFQQ